MVRRRPEADLSPPSLSPRGIERVVCALKSGQWANGPRAQQVEALIASRLAIHPKQVVATSSATAALWAACKVLDVKGPSVCPLTWPATYSGTGGYPVWIDCGQDGHPTSDVAIGVDLWGTCFPGYEVGHSLSPAYILDAAHRFGDKRHGKALSAGIVCAVVYSFAPQKEVSSPDGGALVMSNREDAARARWYLTNCVRQRVWASVGGGGVKGLMNDITAALVREGIRQHDTRKEQRQGVLVHYQRHLGELLVTKPGEASGHLCIVRAPSMVVRDHWRRALTTGKIAWGHHYPMNEEQRMKCPVAAEISDTIITLPCHTRMDKGAVRRVCMRLLTA